MAAILSYLKVMDEMIELYITKWFRKYLKNSDIEYINDPLEKSLRMVHEKKYTLSLWRLYQILDILSSQKHKTPYVLKFDNYLKSRPFLQKSLLSPSFLLQLKHIIDSHVASDKRHKGSLSKKETLKVRKILIWNLQDKDCILYQISETQTTI